MKSLFRLLSATCFLTLGFSGLGGQNDPLLRGPWIGQERERARGFFNVLGRALESPLGRSVVMDRSGRRFELDRRGEIYFNPLDDNWRPVVPSMSDAALHLSEARGLDAKGAHSEALGLYLSLVAMARYAQSPPAYVRDTAAQAAVRINAMKNELPAFPEMEMRNDPCVFFDDIAGETVLSSDRFGWRAAFPGSWRFMRSRSATETGPDRSVVYLGHEGITITAASDSFHPQGRIASAQDLRALWDLRRSLDQQRKESLGFTRTRNAASGTYCGPAGPGVHASFTCAIDDYRVERPQNYTGTEYFSVRPFRALYLEIRFLEEKRAQAQTILDYIARRIHYSSSY